MTTPTEAVRRAAALLDSPRYTYTRYLNDASAPIESVDLLAVPEDADELAAALREAAEMLAEKTQEPTVLPAYSGDNAVCSKCGNRGISVEDPIHTAFGYVPSLEQRMQAGFGPFIMLGMTEPAKLPRHLEGLAAGQEFLARGCGRCGFVWVEATIDDPTIAMRDFDGA